MIWKVSQNIVDFAGQRGKKARVDPAILLNIDGCLCGCLGRGEGVGQGLHEGWVVRGGFLPNCPVLGEYCEYGRNKG
jgi:hypothetical protein